MFRIWLYLKFSNFFRSLFENKQIEKRRKLIEYSILKQSNKKYAVLSSQCRVAFFFILKFLRKKYDKKEIIFCAYNLPEMVNIAKNLNLNIENCATANFKPKKNTAPRPTDMVMNCKKFEKTFQIKLPNINDQISRICESYSNII